MNHAAEHAGSERLVGDPGPVGFGDSASRGRLDDHRANQFADGLTRIFLARHGRTPLNAAGVLRGRLDPPLDFFGHVQAMNLGIILGRQGLKVVMSSPLKRALETAQEIATRAGLDVEVDRRLIDRDYGRWVGRPREAVIARWGSLEAAPDIEPASDVLTRASEALSDLAHRLNAGGAGAIVSHDAVNRLLLRALDPYLARSDELSQETGCYNVLEQRNDRWSVFSFNNIPGEDDRLVAELDEAPLAAYDTERIHHG